MKKLVQMSALLLALCVVLGGCAGTAGGSESTDAAATTTTTTAEPTTSTTVAEPTVDATIVDMTSYFDKDAFSYCANPSDGNFDDLASEGVACYRADEISNTPTFEGVPYQLGSFEDGKKNCMRCEGQTITFEEPTACTFVGVLGAAACGDYSDNFTITYTDGSSEDVFVYMLDWCDPTADYIVAEADHRHQNLKGDWEETAENNRTVYPAYIALYKLETDPSKEVKSVTVPNEDNMNVFGITLAKG